MRNLYDNFYDPIADELERQGVPPELVERLAGALAARLDKERRLQESAMRAMASMALRGGVGGWY